MYDRPVYQIRIVLLLDNHLAMIAANKRLLKATLTQGVLGIQISLVQLYTKNLAAVGTMAALISGFAFAVLAAEGTYSVSVTDYVLTYFFYIPLTVCLISAIFVLSQVAHTYDVCFSILFRN